MNSLFRSLIVTLVATAFFFAQPVTARAGFIVTLDTSGLTSTSGYSYAIDFQFALGGSSTSNSATINAITFGTGGSAGDSSTLSTIGVVSGNLQSQPIGLSGTDGGFADFTQGFTPGDKFQFTVDLTNFPQLGGADTFTFGILYSPGSSFDINSSLNIATTDSLSSSFLQLNTNPSGPVAVLTSTNTDSSFAVFAPTVIPTVTATPAPGSVVLVLSGLPVLFAMWRRAGRAVRLSV